MLTLGPSLVPGVMGSPWVRLVVVLLLRPVVQGCSGWKNCCCCYDALREWFKFRPTTAGQTVVLRTGTRHKVASIHTTRESSFGFSVLLDVVVVVDGMM